MLLSLIGEQPLPALLIDRTVKPARQITVIELPDYGHDRILATDEADFYAISF